MALGALVAVGLDPEWLRTLPVTLGLDGIGVRVAPCSGPGIGLV
jgi:hypothetical protein